MTVLSVTVCFCTPSHPISVCFQIMLCNPICAVVYAVVSWQFFSVRIYREESLLVDFFGVDYIEYQQKVATGLPFIKGCIIPKHVPHDSS